MLPSESEKTDICKSWPNQSSQISVFLFKTYVIFTTLRSVSKLV